MALVPTSAHVVFHDLAVLTHNDVDKVTMSESKRPPAPSTRQPEAPPEAVGSPGNALVEEDRVNGHLEAVDDNVLELRESGSPGAIDLACGEAKLVPDQVIWGLPNNCDEPGNDARPSGCDHELDHDLDDIQVPRLTTEDAAPRSGPMQTQGIQSSAPVSEEDRGVSHAQDEPPSRSSRDASATCTADVLPVQEASGVAQPTSLVELIPLAELVSSREEQAQHTRLSTHPLDAVIADSARHFGGELSDSRLETTTEVSKTGTASVKAVDCKPASILCQATNQQAAPGEPNQTLKSTASQAMPVNAQDTSDSNGTALSPTKNMPRTADRGLVSASYEHLQAKRTRLRPLRIGLSRPGQPNFSEAVQPISGSSANFKPPRQIKKTKLSI